MNSTTTNEGGWASTEMRTWLNDEYYKALPSDLQNVIIDHSSSYSATYDAEEVSYCDDKIWLLSIKEMFGNETRGENLAAFNAETQLAYFANGGSKVFGSGYMWFRSSYGVNSELFLGVNTEGSINGGNPINSNCVFPAFDIG
jgi:hypothetical protein